MKSVLITGASSGIGRVCALRLANAGWRVFATVRKANDADALVRGSNGRITALHMDVTRDAEIEAAAQSLEQALGNDGLDGLDGLVNNAGIAVPGPLEFLPIDQLRHQIEVNVIGQVAVTQAVLPALRRARGRIVFIGSISGRSPMPFTGAYAASKFAIEAITASLRVELRPWGIWTCIIEPAAFGTHIWETSADRADAILETMPPRLEELYGPFKAAVKRVTSRARNAPPPDPVARAVEHALTAARPRARYLVGRSARLRVLLEALPARARDAIIANRLRRL